MCNIEYCTYCLSGNCNTVSALYDLGHPILSMTTSDPVNLDRETGHLIEVIIITVCRNVIKGIYIFLASYEDTMYHNI